MRRVILFGLWLGLLGCDSAVGPGTDTTAPVDAAVEVVADVPAGADVVALPDVAADAPAPTDVPVLSDALATVDAAADAPALPDLGCAPFPPPEYIGSTTCLRCHATRNPELVWAAAEHGHRFMLNRVEDGLPPTYPAFVPDWPRAPGFVLLPTLGVTWEDVSYVIGGYMYKARFIDRRGMCYTGDYEHPGVEYDMADGAWTPFETGTSTFYDCGRCHATGWTEATWGCGPLQDGMSEIAGAWVEPGITCEACHGPGALHQADPSGAPLPTTETCVRCHSRGDDLAIVPAKEGLVRPHEEWQELAQSPHSDGPGAPWACGTCHDPHASTHYDAVAMGTGLRKRCEDCHREGGTGPVVTVAHPPLGCEECHMPHVVPLARRVTVGEGEGALVLGDFPTHLVRLTTAEGATLLTPDGTAANAEVPVEYACRRCHAAMSAAEARTGGAAIHAPLRDGRGRAM